MGLLGGVGETLNFLIDLNADSAVREAKRFGDTVEKETKRSEDSLSHFSRSAATFGIGAVGFGSAMLAGLGKAVEAYSAAEKEHLKLTTAVSNSKQVFDGHGKAVADAAQHLQTYTTVEGDAAEGAAAMLIQFGLTQDQVESLLPLVGDLSRRLGIDMESAAKAVGKAAAGDGAAGLTRMGIALDSTAYSADAFGTTMAGLKGTVAGFAEGEAGTAAGKLVMLKNNLQDIAEGVGAGAADVLGAVVGPISDIAHEGGGASDALEKIGAAGAILGAGSVLIGGLSLAASSVAKLKANLTDAQGALTKLGTGATIAGGVALVGTVLEIAAAYNSATKNQTQFETGLNNLKGETSIHKIGLDLQTMGKGLQGNLDKVDDWVAGVNNINIGGVYIPIQQLGKALEAMKTENPERLAEILPKIKSQVMALDTTGFSERLKVGSASDLQATFSALEKWAASAAHAAGSNKDLANSSQEVADNTQEWTEKLQALNGPLGLYATAADDAAAATKGFSDSAEALDTDEQVKSSLALGDALRGVGASVKDLPPTFDEATAAAGGYNEQQTKAIQAVTSWGDAAKGQIQTLIQSGATSDVVTAKAATYTGALTGVMRQAGLTDAQISAYLHTLGLTPEQVATEVKLSGDAEARFRLGLLQSQIENLPKNVQTQVTQQILVGDYQGALATVNSYYANHPAKLPVQPVLQSPGFNNADREGQSGGRGAPVLSVNGTAAVPVAGASTSSSVSNVTINMPAGTTMANTMASLRRYRRLGGDMGGLLDTTAAIR